MRELVFIAWGVLLGVAWVWLLLEWRAAVRADVARRERQQRRLDEMRDEQLDWRLAALRAQERRLRHQVGQHRGGDAS
jgi:hypothetical protein